MDGGECAGTALRAYLKAGGELKSVGGRDEAAGLGILRVYNIKRFGRLIDRLGCAGAGDIDERSKGGQAEFEI